jgi:DNA polymerase-3 subunit alpha
LATLDIQATCFKLLQKDRVIDPSYTLKECFRRYINPNNLNFDDPRIWERLYDNDVLSVFQWDAASGRKGILATQPQNLAELTAANGLIRLMTAEGEEDQMERFVRIKNNPEDFETEMVRIGLTLEQRQIMHEELDQYNGCAAMQESFMVLSQRLAGYSLKEADALRKTVAKKKMAEITAQKELWWERLDNCTETVRNYLWSVIIAPSLGYGFSLNHALPYSIIGIQCILMGGVLFPPIYWQTACLLQRSGALDGKGANYNKIAKAVAMLSKQGVNIRPIDINKSERDFMLDAEKNIIHYGLEGVKGLKTKAVENILEMRPFESMLDCMVRTGADITSMVSLVKAGAFDGFAPRAENIKTLSRIRAGQKEKLNGQNFLMLSREGHWPTDTPELAMAQRIFNFTQYLKGLANNDILEDEYPLDDRACTFLDEIEYEHNGHGLSKKGWKYLYDLRLQPMKQYLIDHQDEMLDKVNGGLIDEWRDKYFPNNDFAQWEIETMGLCFADHPHLRVVNVDNFDDLPQEPAIATIFTPKNSKRRIPLYKLTMICGIVIAKDKLHSTITLLTADGPVDVKFRKEQFAHYDAQISQQVGGKKKVVERSWLNRGVGLIVHGMRQDDMFMAKTYKNSPMHHSAYRITEVLSTGKIEVQKDRKKGRAEEDESEE